MNGRVSISIGGVALVAAALVFWSAEAIAAAAWPNSEYSYVANYISDLGVPSHEIFKGAEVYSPLASVLNGGWIINGLLVLVAIALLQGIRVTRSSRLSRWQLTLSIGYSAGVIICAFFHEAPVSMVIGHTIGALIGIGGGGVAVLLTGLIVRSERGPAPVAGYLIGSGILGIVFLIMLLVLDFVAPFAGILGLVERVAAYPVLLAQLAGGILILVNRRTLVARLPRARAAVATPVGV